MNCDLHISARGRETPAFHSTPRLVQDFLPPASRPAPTVLAAPANPDLGNHRISGAGRVRRPLCQPLAAVFHWAIINFEGEKSRQKGNTYRVGQLRAKVIGESQGLELAAIFSGETSSTNALFQHQTALLLTSMAAEGPNDTGSDDLSFR